MDGVWGSFVWPLMGGPAHMLGLGLCACCTCSILVGILALAGSWNTGSCIQHGLQNCFVSLHNFDKLAPALPLHVHTCDACVQPTLNSSLTASPPAPDAAAAE
eukprot:355878-Chlamydomonas_euryale.AAC.3